jgi:hypothetical protein
MLHIHGMGSNPGWDVAAVSIAADTISQENIFRGKAPQESGEKRLERYLKYIKAKLRTQCIIEVTLTGAGYVFDQQTLWEPVLLKNGFQRVSHCYNSGSSRRIVVYHLCWDNDSRKGFEKALATLDERYAAEAAAETVEVECKKVRAKKAKPAEAEMPPAL